MKLIPRTVKGRVTAGVAMLAVIALVGLVGGPYVYIHFIKDKPPPPLSFEERDKEAAAAATETTAPAAETETTAAGAATETTTAPASETTAVAAAASGEIGGTWKVIQPSQAGYRVKEILFGQDTEGVGRTSAVDGTIVIDGTTVRSAELGVDLSSVTSDESRRDGQFQTRLMDTANFPVALFVLDTPIELGSLPATGTAIDAKANGTLTLRGVDKPVVIDLKARRTEAGLIEVSGNYDVKFADWGIPDPSNAAASTQDHGLLEFLVTLQRSG